MHVGEILGHVGGVTLHKLVERVRQLLPGVQLQGFRGRIADVDRLAGRNHGKDFAGDLFVIDTGYGDEFKLDIGVLFLIGTGDRRLIVRVTHHTQCQRALSRRGRCATARCCLAGRGSSCRCGRCAGHDHHAGRADAGDA